MRLLYCGGCADVVPLGPAWRACACGGSTGREVDGQWAEVSGAAADVVELPQLELRRAHEWVARMAGDPSITPGTLGPTVACWMAQRADGQVRRVTR